MMGVCGLKIVYAQLHVFNYNFLRQQKHFKVNKHVKKCTCTCQKIDFFFHVSIMLDEHDLSLLKMLQKSFSEENRMKKKMLQKKLSGCSVQ